MLDYNSCPGIDYQSLIMLAPFADHLVGIVRVPVAKLRFAPTGLHHLSRSEKSGDVLRLVHVFRETGFHPFEPIN